MNQARPAGFFSPVSRSAVRERSRFYERNLILVSAVCLLLGLLAVQSFHFRDRDYRQDEIITAHASTFRDASSVVQWMADDIHPPLWRVTAVLWAAQFGQGEPVTRFLSTLLSALTLAVTFRLATDLFGWRVGLAAVFLLGTLAHFQFYSQEFRPYAALMLFSASTQLLLLRWLRAPNLLYAVLYVLSALALCYTHYFGLFLLAAQTVAFVLLVRLDRRRYLRFFALLAAIGLGFLPWLVVFLQVLLIARPYGVTYAEETSAEGLLSIYNAMQIRPLGFGLFLLVAGLVVPVAALLTRRALATGRLMRWRGAWPQLFLLLVNGLALALVIVANTRFTVMTPRNLSIILPGLVILPALVLAVLQPRLRWVAVVLIAVPALLNPVSFMSNGPFSGLLAAVQQDYVPADRVLLNLGEAWWRNGVYHDYLVDRLPGESPESSVISLPQLADDHGVFDPSPDFTMFDAALVDGADHVWLVDRGADDRVETAYRDRLAESYLLLETRALSGETHGTLMLYEYRRLPEATTDIRLGDEATLFHWTLTGSVDVAACQTITVETWWRAERQPDDNYSMTLVLADETGVGITRNDGEPAGVLTRQWQAGQTYLDTRSLQVPCDVAPGEYLLLVGWYDYDTLEALPAVASDGAPMGGLTYLTTLHVAE